MLLTDWMIDMQHKWVFYSIGPTGVHSDIWLKTLLQYEIHKVNLHMDAVRLVVKYLQAKYSQSCQSAWVYNKDASG